MHPIVHHIVIVGLAPLAGAIAIAAARQRSVVARALLLDAFALLMVAALSVVAIERQEPGFLDVALALSLLGFVQTVAAARLVGRREDLR